ncbi:DUF1534 domain-containing protein [Pseudomonas fluorescens]|nr:DUF1534 domain-containing protein [Pseudomonas fluorescens]
MRGNASTDALRSAFDLGRRASRAAFPRRAWERSAKKGDPKVAFFNADAVIRTRDRRCPGSGR